MPRRLRAWSAILTGMLAGLLVGFLGLHHVAPIGQFDRILLDGLIRLSASAKTTGNVVVADIDTVSLTAIGQWPWPRHYVAALVDAIAAQKPAVIGADIIFAEPDRSSPGSLRKSFRQDFGVDLAFSGPKSRLDNDVLLGEAFARTGAVGADYFYFDHADAVSPARPPALGITGRTDLLKLHEATGRQKNTAALSSKMMFSGFINAQPDDDGMMRRLPLLIAYRGAIYPNLSLAMLMRAQGVDAATVDADIFGPYLRVGTRTIPIDSKGFALLSYQGHAGVYPSISAIDLIESRTNAGALQGKLVLIGATAPGLHDLHATLFDPQFPGVKVQAAMLDNMANGRFVRMPAWGGLAALVSCVLAGGMAGLLFSVTDKTLRLFAGTLGMAALPAAFSLAAFQGGAWFFPAGAPILTAALLFPLFFVLRYILEKQRAQFWFSRLERTKKLTIESMAAVAELRHHETGTHIRRTQSYVRAIAIELRRKGKHLDILTPEYIEMLAVSSALHDIGKVGIPDHILLKPGKLTEDEWELMKRHSDYGKKIICDMSEKIEDDDFLQTAAEIALTHHECWNGTGYPQGLAGQDIPLSGRIMAVADVYDALISERCYQAAYSHEQAIAIMRERAEGKFDPDVFAAFLAIEDEILTIAISHEDARAKMISFDWVRL